MAQNSQKQPTKSANRPSSTSAKRSPARGSGSNGPVASAREAVVGGAQGVAGGAQTAGRAVGSAANAAKLPAVAGGAALAGLVGGMAIARRGRRRVLGVPIPGTARPLVKIKRRGPGTRELIKAAGNTGRQMAELTSEVRLAREQLQSGRRRSPIEVVLDGLTARRGRDLSQ
jgi:hypothetical protein